MILLQTGQALRLRKARLRDERAICRALLRQHEFLRALSGADFRGEDVAPGVDRKVMHPVEIAGHTAAWIAVATTRPANADIAS
jgi:hypothetical protein